MTFHFVDEEPTKVTMIGYLTSKEVEKLPIAEEGQYKFSQHASCYFCNYDQLRSARKFLGLLSKIGEREVNLHNCL